MQLATSQIIIPFSFKNRVCTFLPLMYDNEVYSFEDLMYEINEAKSKVISIQAQIKELIVATPKDLFTENEEGTVKDQIDYKSEELFSNLWSVQAKFEQLTQVKTILDEISERSEISCEEAFNSLFREEFAENRMEYRYYKGSDTYDIQNMSVFDRNVSDIKARALDNSDQSNLNYKDRLIGDQKYKFFIEIQDSENHFTKFIDSEGRLFFDSKEDAERVVINNVFCLSVNQFLDLSWIKNHCEMFVGIDNDSFFDLVLKNKEDFCKRFIKELYYDSDVRFHGKRQDPHPFILKVQDRLLNLIDRFKEMDQTDYNELFNEYAKKFLNEKEKKQPEIEVINNFAASEIVEKFDKIADYEFLNIFVKICLKLSVKDLYRIVEVRSEF
jgi:hypothetical protein